MHQKKLLPRFFIRSSSADQFLEKFLIAAVSTILFIRFFLELTDYPQLGGGGLHIAHMLWSGFLMLAALIILLIFLNKESRDLAAILGGIGFGTFIDEIGKFVTSDNNYFFKPSIALIYAIFIVLFLIYRSIERHKKLTSREYLINALEATKEIVVHDLDEKEKKEALHLLKHADQSDPVTLMLIELYKKLESLPAEQPSLVSRLRKKFHKFYLGIIENSWFIRLVTSVFIVTSVFAVIRIVLLLPFFVPRTFSEWGFVISSALSGFFVIIGIYLSQKSRLATYFMFKRAVLISIFLTQFFLFVEDQFSALLGLGFSILMLLVMDYLINEELELEKNT